MVELSVEDFAVVAAHLGHFPPKEFSVVLARLRVPEAAFFDAAEAIPQRLAAQQSAGEQTGSDTFQQSFDACRRDLADKKPLSKEIAPLRVSGAAGDDMTLDPLTASHSADALPFVAGPPMRLQPAQPMGANESGGTIGLEAAPGAATPFAAADHSRWTVERYAAYTAERRWGDQEQVRKSYGIHDGAEEYGLIVHFNRRFADDPGLRERWTDLVQQRTRQLNRGQ